MNVVLVRTVRLEITKNRGGKNNGASEFTNMYVVK